MDLLMLPPSVLESTTEYLCNPSPDNTIYKLLSFEYFIFSSVLKSKVDNKNYCQKNQLQKLINKSTN